MPIYIYKPKKGQRGCKYCQKGFELMQGVNDKPSQKCPQCGAAVEKVFSPFALGFSKSGLDQKAKEKGFHKLKRVDKGKFEKLY